MSLPGAGPAEWFQEKAMSTRADDRSAREPAAKGPERLVPPQIIQAVQLSKVSFTPAAPDAHEPSAVTCGTSWLLAEGPRL